MNELEEAKISVKQEKPFYNCNKIIESVGLFLPKMAKYSQKCLSMQMRMKVRPTKDNCNLMLNVVVPWPRLRIQQSGNQFTLKARLMSAFMSDACKNECDEHVLIDGKRDDLI